MAKKIKVATEQTLPVTGTEKDAQEKDLFKQEGELVVDVFETSSEFVVLTAIAGVQIKDLDIAVEKEMMIIKGERQDPEAHPERKYFYQECYWGAFSRKVVLPEDINTELASAEMDKGILTIKIPKNGKDDKGLKKGQVKIS